MTRIIFSVFIFLLIFSCSTTPDKRDSGKPETNIQTENIIESESESADNTVNNADSDNNGTDTDTEVSGDILPAGTQKSDKPDESEVSEVSEVSQVSEVSEVSDESEVQKENTESSVSYAEEAPGGDKSAVLKDKPPVKVHKDADLNKEIESPAAGQENGQRNSGSPPEETVLQQKPENPLLSEPSVIDVNTEPEETETPEKSGEQVKNKEPEETAESDRLIDEEKNIPDSVSETAAVPSEPENSRIAPVIPLPQPSVEKETAENNVDIPESSESINDRIMNEPGEITISLEGTGWIFRSDLSTGGSWKFTGRKTLNNLTEFTFIFTENGSWNMVFERQDLKSGERNRVSKNIVVGGSGEPSAAESDNIEESEQDTYSSKMASLEKESNPEEIIKAALDVSDVPRITAWLEEYLKGPVSVDLLKKILAVLEENPGYSENKAEVLEKLADTDSGENKAEWLYRLAEILESPGEPEDMDRAASIYSEIMEKWPYSEWRIKSEERLMWLRRHYYRIQ